MEVTAKSGQLPLHTPDFLKQRKFMVMIPVLIIPFLLMAFWALGGGRQQSNFDANNPANGLNTTLPQAQFKDEQEKDKMGVYQNAKKDSVGLNADGISPAFTEALGLNGTKLPRGNSSVKLNTSVTSDATTNSAEASEVQIKAKLAQINSQINQPEQTRYAGGGSSIPETDADVKRLSKMMKSMNNTGAGADPEMKQLSRMLTQIQNIQNPESVTEKKTVNKPEKPFKAIAATIDGKQKVRDGGAVKLKLTESVTLKGQLFPVGQEVYGTGQITNQRLIVRISNIRIDQQIVPVDLIIYSLDGMPGLPAPEAELSAEVGANANSALQNMQIMSMDQSIASQAAAGGINAAKGLFSKKIRKIKVKLDDQFPVLLKINK
ncbi:conjugative transposon protein TraM [Mucilaginibacter sp. CSA2-8R]|uniref:conjugative transposon protein TraM n=1 Tax=Mucilaginibacter sp. CSA2-8R TaxID=3141542 RepID=UPI00315C569E